MAIQDVCVSNDHHGKPLAAKPLPFEFWNRLGAPRFVVSPMVDQSELAFRILTRRYGAELAYTPMLHSRLMFEDPKYSAEHFQTCGGEDRPLVAQLCGDDPQTVLRAAKILETQVDAVDLNCGCPQGIARRGHYGAYLLRERDLICEIIQTLHNNLSVPATCKIRKVSNELQDTMNLCYSLEASGCSVICLHGRTKEQKSQQTGECDWETIGIVKKRLRIPVIANGGIETREEAIRCLEVTGADAVMSAEAILENPALFLRRPLPAYTPPISAGISRHCRKIPSGEW